MNTQNFTLKSQQLIKSSIDLATLASNQLVTPLHLLGAFLDSNDAIINDLIIKSGADLNTLKSKTDNELKKLPSVSGENIQSSLSQEYNRIFLSRRCRLHRRA